MIVMEAVCTNDGLWSYPAATILRYFAAHPDSFVSAYSKTQIKSWAQDNS